MTVLLDGGRVEGGRLVFAAAVLVLPDRLLALHTVELVLDLNPHLPLVEVGDERVLHGVGRETKSCLDKPAFNREQIPPMAHTLVEALANHGIDHAHASAHLEKLVRGRSFDRLLHQTLFYKVDELS